MDEHADELTLDAYVVEWLERRRSQLRPTTLKSYRQAVDCYIRPNLGGLRLDEVDRRRLERFYAWLLVGGGRGGKPLSPTSVQYVHAILGRVFEDARLDGLLETNPGRGARRPIRHPDEVELDEIPAVWTPAQAARFLAFVDDHERRQEAADWRDRWGLVFTNEVGAPIDPMVVTKAFRALVDEAPVCRRRVLVTRDPQRISSSTTILR